MANGVDYLSFSDLAYAGYGAQSVRRTAPCMICPCSDGLVELLRCIGQGLKRGTTGFCGSYISIVP